MNANNMRKFKEFYNEFFAPMMVIIMWVFVLIATHSYFSGDISTVAASMTIAFLISVLVKER